MAKIGILGCQATTEHMNCVMIGCMENLQKKEGMFSGYGADDQVTLTGVISCGGCPTAVGADRIWLKVKALTDYGIDSLHLTSCMVHLCPFKQEFLRTIRKEYPDLTIVEGTHTFDDVEALKTGVHEVVSQRAVTPQTMNDAVFKRIKIT